MENRTDHDSDSKPVLEKETHFEFRHMKLARILLAGMTVLAWCCWIILLMILHHETKNLFRWPVNLNALGSVLQAYGFVIGGWFSLCVCMLLLTLITFRESWTINSDAIRHRGFFRSKLISTDRITKLDWWPVSRVIVIRSPDYRIPIFIDALSIQQRVELSKYLHQTVPIEKQQYWELYDRMLMQNWQQRLDSPSFPV